MHILTILVLAVWISVVLVGCLPDPTTQIGQQPSVSEIPVITETAPPPKETDPVPTKSPSPTTTQTLEQVKTETLSSTAVIIDPSATNTAIPSATATFEPIEIYRGNFYGIDENHKGSGNAVIHQIQVEEYTLSLENFEVTNGPGLHVILAEDSNPYSIATLGDYLDVGELISTSGDQHYPLPKSLNTDKYGSVVIYCVPFQAIFAIAPIR